MKDIKQKDKQYIAPTYGRFDLALERAEGRHLYGEGRAFLDFGSGIAVNIFGASDPIWADAVSEQAHKLSHVSNLYYSEPCVRLAEMLCRRTGASKVFFGNSGAEANECAIKCARKYSHDKYGEGRHVIVTLKQSFHGRTMATLAATGQEVFHTDFMPFPGGFRYAEPNDIEALDAILGPDVCAFMFECVQGEGGVTPLEPAFLQRAAELCAARDILLIDDEVQCGNGRTGALYAYMNYGICPDLMTTAKGLGGGLPIGACLFFEKTEAVMGAGKHGSTFGGNPIACAGACSILERLDETFLATVCEKSDYLIEKLETVEGVRSVSGAGLMLGLETACEARAVVAACQERGLLVLTAKSKVRLLPPLNLSYDDIDEAVGILRESLAACMNIK